MVGVVETALRLDDEFSLFELLRDLFTKRFQATFCAP
jgi:hypothetical protein